MKALFTNRFQQMKAKIIQNLWHYQRKHHGDESSKRFPFIVDPPPPLFAQALVLLQQGGLVMLAENGQFCLTDKGYDYCKSHQLSLSPEDRFFEDY